MMDRIRLLKLSVLGAVCLAFAGFAWSSRSDGETVAPETVEPVSLAMIGDSVKSRQAFLEAYTVFMSPRCANCHPAADAPTQGDDMSPHTMAVTRGKDGKGVYGQTCTTCHQKENLEGEHMPPGTSVDWHMPPENMKMVFQGRTAAQLCRQFKDPKQNGGHKTAREAMEHIQKRDPLVLWGWQPGNGRTTPPMTFEAFAAKVEEWVASGAACPD